jgi:CubicO group peptidase (beta-lactamase class C family)
MQDRRTFLKSLCAGAAGLATPFLPVRSSAEPWAIQRTLPRSSPEAQGLSSNAIMSFLEAAAKANQELHSLMIVRHGHVVAEGWWAPYRPHAVHLLYSLSKSFTSTAVGFAVAEHRIKLDDRIVQFFLDQLPTPVSDNLAALTVRHLLMMSTGHAQDSTPIITAQEDWVTAFLAFPIEHAPGSVFLYDSGASYMLSAIVQRVCGLRLVDYLGPRLFKPLEIPAVRWQTCPRGINTGGWGLSVTTEALAKFGEFYRQEGRWRSKQLLPRDWIDTATSFQIQQPAPEDADPSTALERLKQSSDWHQGYGYQFWRCRHHAYRADGAFGQFCIVLPEQDAVVVMTSMTMDMQGLLNLLWQHLLPAFQQGPLARDVAAESELKARLAALSLPLPPGATSSALLDKRTELHYLLEPNSLAVQSVSLRFDRDCCEFTLRTGVASSQVRCGVRYWLDGVTDMPGTPAEWTELVGTRQLDQMRPAKIAAAGAWKDDRTFEMVWRYYETPHHDTVTCRLEDNKIRIEFMNSITQPSPADPTATAWHHERRPVLVGRVARV